ncbi:hypothetical protein FB45DRAFT_785988, partial [Roridomyces roridus]
MTHDQEKGLPPVQPPRKGRSRTHNQTNVAQQANAQAAETTTMPDPDTDNHVEDEACAKIWSIYIGEAERYDAALVESWKADMEGMLIFSGLFSASLTAFLIESYKTLQPDSGSLTVEAILQVSQQLSALANGTIFVPSATASAGPTTGSLVCNVLWFISLALSLTCALLANLVEQWAREFIHKTELRPSPTRRARVLSFLYFGLKHFQMHTIVDVIPLLLHASLILFFAGLVAFLLPVNHIIMWLMGGTLLVFLLLYLVLTVLPVIYLDCPYRTPLSAPLWSILQFLIKIFKTQIVNSAKTTTMTEAVVQSALVDTKTRDQHAIAWTLESLTDDMELLPFVEAIPEIIHGPTGFLCVHDDMFLPLLGDIGVPSPLVARILNLLTGTLGMRNDDPLAKRRQVAGLKALWALSMMPCAWDCYFDTIPLTISPPGGWDPIYFPTVTLVIDYHNQQWSHCIIEKFSVLLADFSQLSQDSWDDLLPKATRLLQLIIKHESLYVQPPSMFYDPPTTDCLGPFTELKKLTTNGVDLSTTITLHLEQVQQIVNNLQDVHDWAANIIAIIGTFIQ